MSEVEGSADSPGGTSDTKFHHVITMQDLDAAALITKPEPGDRDRLVELFSRGFFPRIVSTHEPVALWSNFHLEGVVAPVYSSEAKALELAYAAAAAYEVQTDVARISGLWDFLLQCAECGYEGAILNDYYPLSFFNRLSDMDRSRPSLMWLRFPDSQNEIYGFFFSRTGVVDMPSGATVKWVRHERFDKASRRFVLHGDPLPEEVDAHVISGPSGVDVIFPDGATILGPYVSDLGAIAVFSAPQFAAQFARKQGLLAAVTHGHPVLRDGYQIERIPLLPLLDRIYAHHGPFVDIGLNPLSHRFRQGWFFKRGDHWHLQSISGVWDVRPDGIGPRSNVDAPKVVVVSEDDSELALHGRQTVVQHPFKRLFGADRSPVSEDDAAAIVERELAGCGLPIEITKGSSIPTDAFVFDAFDKITGDRFAASAFDDAHDDLGFVVFHDFVAACAYLVHHVVPQDEDTRLRGYSLCHGGGRAGSDNPARERQISTSVVSAISKTLRDALVRGYSPEHARHAMRLMQDATVTCEITSIGYFGDLLFYGEDAGAAVEERVPSADPDDPSEAARRKRRIQSLAAQRRSIADAIRIDPSLVAQLRTALQGAFELLEADSVVIAATALEEFRKVGSRNGYDYAGITMKLSKLVERELGARLFKPWRDAARIEIGKDGIASLRTRNEVGDLARTEAVLLSYVEKRSKLDLGAMRYALRASGASAVQGPLTSMLGTYVSTMSDAGWLTGEALESLLSDISTQYRNGGVHEHIVSFAVCREAMERILTGPDPMLSRLLLATSGKVIQ
jgi:hypothetical protein